ncbi:hypothetical protein GCM10010468_46760 [Actinocorallia longicatena]|uniref:Hemerythrin-like domain-containing protein n=1 Tax=Actinocorallia longicatena TaxID=111803 RepID=A0ABP6QDA4_9ACTN
MHDMVVVHRAFRRELRLAGELVRGVPAGELRRAAVVTEHLRLVLIGLHLHHGGEDEMLWPLLLERAAPSAALIARMEDQHGEVGSLISQIETALGRWEAESRPAAGEELAALTDRLAAVLVEHLDEEERVILPLAARCLSREEWEALGQAGVAKMTKAQLPIMFGMIMEDATPGERKEMLGALPVPVRVLLRTWGARAYRRYVGRVRDGR